MNKKVKNDRLASNGFHVHYLPYADDIRTLPKNDTTRAANDEVELFKNVIRGLKFKYRPDKFENPALQTLWRNIEATALNKGEPDEFVDLTIPSVENQNRKVAGFVDELKQMIFPPGYVMGATKKSAAAKRKVFELHYHDPYIDKHVILYLNVKKVNMSTSFVLRKKDRDIFICPSHSQFVLIKDYLVTGILCFFISTNETFF